MDTRFHCVYLLTSLDPQCEGDYYIGYTVNPLRRLRQHNGELVNGARRTSRRGRPWTIVCCVSGFTEDRAALKFEWCWQNPTVSARLKHGARALKGLRRLPYAVGILHLLVHAPLFNQLDLTLHIFEAELLQEAKAKVEVFLAMREGPKPHQRILSPQQRSDEACASPLASTQVLNVSSAYGSAAAPTSLLPPLEPSALFHVEVLTRQAFEDTYLSHDRCLLLPSNVGVAGSGGGGAAGQVGEDSCLSASCPYDVSALSQAARAEWSNASLDQDCAIGGEESDGNDEELTRRIGWLASHTPSRTPSPELGRAHDDDDSGNGNTAVDMVLGYRSASVSVSRLFDVPRSPSRASLTEDGRVERDVAASPASKEALSTNAEADDGGGRSRPRIPLRFAHYSEADFASAHAEAQYRLHHGLLPCSLCALPLRPPCVLHCSRAPFCELRCHLSCLAMWMLYAEEEALVGDVRGEKAGRERTQAAPTLSFRRLIPSQPCPCPLCGVPLQWGALIKELKKRVVVEERLHAAQRRTRIEQRWQARLARINDNRVRRERRGCQKKVKRSRLNTQGTSCTATVNTPVTPFSQPTNADDPPILLPGACRGREQPPLTASSSPATAPASSPLLSWTAFCEDDWLL